MSPKVTKEHKDKRQAEILEAAKTVFKRKGFELTTMKDVVEESGFSRGGVYLYFSSTEEMFRRIIEAGLDEGLRKLDKSAENRSVWKTITSYLDGLTEGLREAEATLAPVQFEYLVTAWRNEERREYLEKRYDLFVTRFSKLLQKGIDQGEFRPLQPLATITKFFLNVNDGIIQNALYFDEDKADVSGMVEAAKLYLKTVLQVNEG
ncbi:TetR family transcriptional regulator [Bacillus sp. 0909A]|uniref:TetR family transcriptional regulator n=1 Tax=Bacillus sp. 0909A TaxID=3120561 RepID=UPI002FDA4CA0